MAFETRVFTAVATSKPTFMFCVGYMCGNINVLLLDLKFSRRWLRGVQNLECDTVQFGTDLPTFIKGAYRLDFMRENSYKAYAFNLNIEAIFPARCQWTSTGLHGVTSEMTELLTCRCGNAKSTIH
jgi:hypothetical protein